MKFLRQDYFKLKRLKRKWRRPKGRQSKLRVGKGGSGKKPSIGYKKGKKTTAMIRNIKDLQGITAGTLSSSVGARKRAIIAEEAKKLGIIITNFKPKKKSNTEKNDKIENKKEKSEKE